MSQILIRVWPTLLTHALLLSQVMQYPSWISSFYFLRSAKINTVSRLLTFSGSDREGASDEYSVVPGRTRSAADESQSSISVSNFSFSIFINQVARFYLNLTLHLLQIITFFHYLHFSSITIIRSIYQRTARLEHSALLIRQTPTHIGSQIGNHIEGYVESHAERVTSKATLRATPWVTLWLNWNFRFESLHLLEHQSDTFIAYAYRTIDCIEWPDRRSS